MICSAMNESGNHMKSSCFHQPQGILGTASEEKGPLLGRYIQILKPIPVDIQDNAVIMTADILLPLTQHENWNLSPMTDTEISNLFALVVVRCSIRLDFILKSEDQ